MFRDFAQHERSAAAEKAVIGHQVSSEVARNLSRPGASSELCGNAFCEGSLGKQRSRRHFDTRKTRLSASNDFRNLRLRSLIVFVDREPACFGGFQLALRFGALLGNGGGFRAVI